jgi:hypothetical protein
VCYARSPDGVLFVHRCDQIPRLTWRDVTYEGKHGEDFYIDGMRLNGWDPEMIEQRLLQPHPVLFTSEELQMHEALRYVRGVA